MAKYYNSNGTSCSDPKKAAYCITQSGDMLSKISLAVFGNANKYQQIADWNKISNPHKIRIGQKIYLSKSGASSGSSGSSSSKSKVTNYPTNVKVGLLTNSDKTLLATWDWRLESKTEKYQVVWKYWTYDGKELIGTSTSVSVDEESYKIASSRLHEYTIPDNAKKVAFRVKAVAKKKKNSKGEETKTEEFRGDWIPKWIEYNVQNPLAAPGKPSVELSGLKLTSTIEDLDTYGTHVEFQIVKNNTTTLVTSPKRKINIYDDEIEDDVGYVSWNYTLTAGNEYKVRARVLKGSLTSEWSAFSNSVKTYPVAPSKLNDPKEYVAMSEVNEYAVQLSWSKVASATEYVIQYATSKEGLDIQDLSTEITVKSESTVNPTPPTSWVITGLSSGEYFFRVCASNDGGDSKWTSVKSLVLGSKPGIPTTWSSTSKATIGETIKLYWTHNSLDGSNQHYCGFNIVVGSTTLAIKDAIANAADSDKTPLKLLYEYPSTNSYFRVYRVYDYIYDSTQLYAELDTAVFTEDSKIQWQVRTAGLTKEFGEWSTLREIELYRKPEMELMVTDEFTVDEDGVIHLPEAGDEPIIMDILESFPFYMKASVTPKSQIPLGYHVTVSALDSYETVDQIGNTKTISIGDEVFSQNYDASTELLVEFSAGNIDLESGIRYAIKCFASLDSGLTAEASSKFSVSWIDPTYSPNMEYTLDTDTYSLAIRPYCEERTITVKMVENTSEGYKVSSDVVDADVLENVYTTTGEKVLLGVNASGKEICYCIAYVNSSGIAIEPTYYNVTKSGTTYITGSKLKESNIIKRITTTGEEVCLGVIDGAEIFYSSVEEGTLVDNVTLSVYRREYDGSFTEIETDLSNINNTFVPDPHPALDYARYRIVAKSMDTGSITYYDAPGIKIDCSSVIIQWAEQTSSFEGWNEDPLAEPPVTASILFLPYNIDVTNNTSPDVSHVKYVGRKHPVSYYGTHLGESATWNVVVPKDDIETLYQLRRLKVWMGDVYVREPSGTGYWATITVSDPRKHNEVTVSVTLNITRVEGGK